MTEKFELNAYSPGMLVLFASTVRFDVFLRRHRRRYFARSAIQDGLFGQLSKDLAPESSNNVSCAAAIQFRRVCINNVKEKHRRVCSLLREWF
jgi:hypothetical protein